MKSMKPTTQECGLCMENYVESGRMTPLILRCSHTYCKGCIIQLATRATDRKEIFFSCPECRQQIPVAFEGTKNLAALQSNSEFAEERPKNPFREISNQPFDDMSQPGGSLNVEMQSQQCQVQSEPHLFNKRRNSADVESTFVEKQIDTNVRNGRAQSSISGYNPRHSKAPAVSIQSNVGRQFMNQARQSQAKYRVEADLIVCGRTHGRKDFYCNSCYLFHCSACLQSCGNNGQQLSQDDIIFASFGSRPSLTQLKNDCEAFEHLDIEAMMQQDRVRAESAQQCVSKNAEELRQGVNALFEPLEKASAAINFYYSHVQKKKIGRINELQADVPVQKDAANEALRQTEALRHQNCQSSSQASLIIQSIVSNYSSRTIESMEALTGKRGSCQFEDFSSISTSYAAETIDKLAKTSEQFFNEYFLVKRQYVKEAKPCPSGYTLTYNAAKPHELLAMPGQPAISDPLFLSLPCLLFDLRKKSVKYFQIKDRQTMHLGSDGFKCRDIAFVHKMIFILESYNIDGQSFNLLYKVAGDQLICADEIASSSPRFNFTMKASKKYLALVGGDDGVRALNSIDIMHLMETNILVNKKLKLSVDRVKPAVTFDTETDSRVIVFGGWLDPTFKTFIYTAEIIEVITGDSLRQIDFTTSFTQMPDRFSSVSAFFQTMQSPLVVVHTTRRSGNVFGNMSDNSSEVTVEVLSASNQGQTAKAYSGSASSRKYWMPKMFGTPTFQQNQLQFVAYNTDKVVKEAYCRINFKIGLRCNLTSNYSTLIEEPETEADLVLANAQHFNRHQLE